MNEPIMISPADLWQFVAAICGAIITLSGAGAVIANIIHKAKEPKVIVKMLTNRGKVV